MRRAILSAVVMAGIVACGVIAEAEVVIGTVTVGNPANARCHRCPQRVVDLAYLVDTKTTWLEPWRGRYVVHMAFLAVDSGSILYDNPG